MKFFILLDTSGSMEGTKIGALNDAMSNILVSLQGAAFDGRQIDLAVLTFGKTAQWMYESPKPVMDFGWKELKANGMTPLGTACEALDIALGKYSVVGEDICIILLSDGCPTDDYDTGIALLDNNRFFSLADKYANTGFSVMADYINEYSQNALVMKLLADMDELFELYKDSF